MLEKIKKLRAECPICESKKNLIYGKRIETVKINREEIPVEVKVYYCTDGDHYFYDLEDEEKKYQTVYREYRKRKNLLQPEDIKQIRQLYGLSQRAFAKFLGWGLITIQRYETGALQDNVHNDLLYFLKDINNFKKYFKSKKQNLPEKIIKKIELNLKKLEEKEKQLNIEFFLKHTRFEENKTNLGSYTSTNIAQLKTIFKVFARLEKIEHFQIPIEIIQKAKLSAWQTPKKNTDKTKNFLADSANREGELALAA